MSKIDVTIAIDPGFSGAIGVLLGDQGCVFDIPTYKIESGKTKTGKVRYRTEYDVPKMVDILKPFAVNNAPLIALEDVSAMTGEGVTSSFHFGQGKGICIGIMVALFGKYPHLIRAATWKKGFPEITNSDTILVTKEHLKALRSQVKVIKDKAREKVIRKEIAVLNRKVKAESKDSARKLATSLFPEIEDKFRLKKHDGRAESLLIALYARRKYRELV